MMIYDERSTTPIVLHNTGIISQPEMITPYRGAYFLSNIGRKRPVSDKRVSVYKNDMIRGNWRLNGETIIISKTGKILNGVHRCNAGIKCNIPFPSMVIYGIDDIDFLSMDHSKSRTNKDIVASCDIKHYSAYTAALRLMHLYKSGQVIKQQGISLPALLLPNEEIPEYEIRTGIGLRLRESLERTIKIQASSMPFDKILYPPAISILHYLISEDENGGVDIADACVKKIYSNFDISPGDPIGVFRHTVSTFISPDSINTKDNIRSNGEGFRLMMYAWNKFINNEKVYKSYSLSFIDKFIPYTNIPLDNSLYIDISGKLQRTI